MSYFVNVVEFEKARLLKGLKSDTALEKASGVSRNTISSIKEGKLPGSQTIEKLAAALDLSSTMIGEIFFAVKLT